MKWFARERHFRVALPNRPIPLLIPLVSQKSGRTTV
jgi:hypothetical protein